MNKTHSNKWSNTTPEGNQQNGWKYLGSYRVLSLPTWPRLKKTNEKTWTSSLEDFKKETIYGVQA